MGTKRGKLPPTQGVASTLQIPRIARPAPFCNTALESTLDYAVQLQSNPSILAEDSKNYSDQAYVRALSDLYWAIAKTTEFPVMQLKKFRISDMETALSKLKKEHRDEYKELCKYWGVLPEEHRSKKPTQGVLPHSHLIRLTRWGYFDLFFANMDDIIDLVIKKTYTSSETMTKTNIAKYAQIFALFITGHSIMPYDIEKFAQMQQLFAKMGKKMDAVKFRESFTASIMSSEKNGCWNAGMLYHFYARYMKELPDGAIHIGKVEYFMDLIDYGPKLIIKEFMDMLSSYEKTDFKAWNLHPISNNLGIRALKEKIFPFGMWNSNVSLFMTNTLTEKEIRAYRSAYNRFERNGFVFGQGVEPVKAPRSCRHAHSRECYTMNEYKYTGSPFAVRVSDPNELLMMRVL